jgi:hypothetical protein
MCPVCIATAALIAGSATSTGGLAAVAVKKFFTRNTEILTATNSNQKENRDDQHDDRS